MKTLKRLFYLIHLSIYSRLNEHATPMAHANRILCLISGKRSDLAKPMGDLPLAAALANQRDQADYCRLLNQWD